MKKCPYCSEDIQDEAIKCKHCGEWLNKTKPANIVNKTNSFFKSGANYLEEQKRKGEKKRSSHLNAPTADTPFSYKDIHLYASYLQAGSIRIELDEIFGIFFHSSSQSYNGITSIMKIKFAILFSPGDRVSLFPENGQDLIVASGAFITFARKKDIERILFLFQLIQKMTVKYRLIRYINELKKKGSFKYMDEVQIFNNGDLQYKNGKIINIKSAYDNDLISFGSKFTGLRSSASNPFLFVIYPTQGIKVKIFGFELNSKIEIPMLLNRDCFEEIIREIITTGKIVNTN